MNWNRQEWTNFIQMNTVFTTVGKNTLEGMEQPSWSKRVQNAIIGCNLKNDQKKKKNPSICFQGKPFNIMVIQLYVSTTNAKEA